MTKYQILLGKMTTVLVANGGGFLFFHKKKKKCEVNVVTHPKGSAADTQINNLQTQLVAVAKAGSLCCLLHF